MTIPPVEPDIATPSVKLYPRLAIITPPLSRKSARAMHTRVERKSAPGDSERNAARTNLQARLLRMIVENERIRRNEQRPNAS